MQSHSEIIPSNKTTTITTEALPGLYKELVDLLNHLSEVYYYQGQLDMATKLYESNIYLLSIEPMTIEDKARFQGQRGKMLYYQSSLAESGFEAAWAVLLDARKLAESAADRACLAKVLNLMGSILYAQAFANGNFEEPRSYFQHAFELRQQLADTQGMSESLFYVGLTYQNKDGRTEDDRAEGLKQFHKAQALAQAGGHKLEESYTARHIAAEHQEDGDLEEALIGFERSLTLREQIGYKVYQPSALLTIGHVYRARQELDRAISYYQKAYDLAVQMAQTVSMVRLQITLGDVQKEKQNIDGALKHYENACQAAAANDYQKGVAAATAKIKATA